VEIAALRAAGSTFRVQGSRSKVPRLGGIRFQVSGVRIWKMQRVRSEASRPDT